MKPLLVLCCAAYTLSAQVTYERIAAAATDPTTWLTYSGGYAGHRYSPLARIERGNVARLRPAWIYQTNDLNPFEATSPDTGLLYVPVREEGTVFYRATAEYRAGSYFSAGGMRGIPGVEPSGSIQALDPLTGERRWGFPLHSPPWAGVLSTAGGLVFSGTNEGNFFALDAASGKPPWDFQTGAPVYAAPIAYEFEGRQYIAVAAGRSLMAFTIDSGPSPK